MRTREMDCFVINRMYAGDYLKGNNIGHEIINLFADDNGDNYIYINADGVMGSEYDGKVKAVLLTRMAESIHRQEVLGIAIVDAGSQIVYNKGGKKGERTPEHIDTDAYLAQHPVKYGGVDFVRLFEKNIWEGEFNNYHLITFKTKKLLMPYKNQRIFICDKKYTSNEVNAELKDIEFSRQSPKQYICSDEEIRDYATIEKLINNEKLWDKNRKPEKIKLIGKKAKDEENFNYLDIVGRQDDENVFSNLIAYFIGNDGKLLKDFCKEVLGIDGVSENALVEREKSANGPRIDIFIQDDKYAIVIENKIKSEINGANERHNFDGELIQSQLADYYNYVEKTAQGLTKKYYILMPNYHKIDIKKYKHSEKYQKLEYSDLYEFFAKHKYHNESEKGYYDDFVKALHRHAEDYYDDQYAEMKRRFIRRLEDISNS